MMISAFSRGSAIILTALPVAVFPSPLPATILSAKIFESSGANVVAEAYCSVCSFICRFPLGISS